MENINDRILRDRKSIPDEREDRIKISDISSVHPRGFIPMETRRGRAFELFDRGTAIKRHNLCHNIYIVDFIRSGYVRLRAIFPYINYPTRAQRGSSHLYRI